MYGYSRYMQTVYTSHTVLLEPKTALRIKFINFNQERHFLKFLGFIGIMYLIRCFPSLPDQSEMMAGRN